MGIQLKRHFCLDHAAIRGLIHTYCEWEGGRNGGRDKRNVICVQEMFHHLGSTTASLCLEWGTGLGTEQMSTTYIGIYVPLLLCKKQLSIFDNWKRAASGKKRKCFSELCNAIHNHNAFSSISCMLSEKRIWTCHMEFAQNKLSSSYHHHQWQNFVMLLKTYPGPRGFLPPQREYQATDKEVTRENLWCQSTSRDRLTSNQ